MKKVLLLILGTVCLVAVIFFILWTFAPNQTIKFIVNSPISLLITKPDQSDTSEFWSKIQNHKNPPDKFDNFDGPELSEAWYLTILNGQGFITTPPNTHASDIRIIDGQLVLSVLHDPDFHKETSTWSQGHAAPEQYNNASVIGLPGYSPTLTQNIEIEAKIKISKDFHGSTGIWVHESGTFDSQTGYMQKPFRSFGFSYLGPTNTSPFNGNQLEAVVGFIPVCAQDLNQSLNQTEFNIIKMVWVLEGENAMRADIYINGQHAESCTFPSFYPGEIQLWADNYLVNGLDLSFQNIPEGTTDQIVFDYIKVKVVKR